MDSSYWCPQAGLPKASWAAKDKMRLGFLVPGPAGAFMVEFVKGGRVST